MSVCTKCGKYTSPIDHVDKCKRGNAHKTCFANKNKMSKCYDCARGIVGEKVTRDILSEDGNYMPLSFHPECYIRAVSGGETA